MNIMDKENAIKYIRSYYSNKQFDIQTFLTEYAIDCGKKDLSLFPKFLEVLIFTNQIQDAVDHAINYYIKKFDIYLIHKVTNNNKIFITAY